MQLDAFRDRYEAIARDAQQAILEGWEDTDSPEV